MAERAGTPDSHGGSSEHENPGASDTIAVSFSAGSPDLARDTQPVSAVATTRESRVSSTGTTLGPPGADIDEFAPYFHPSPPWSCWEYVKVAIACVTLLPVRVILVAAIIVVYGLVGYLCTCGAPVGKPLSRPRQAVLKAWGIGSARVGLFILGYYYIPVRGKRDPRFRTIIANHLSFMDILVFMACCFPAFVAKAGVLRVPFVGRLSRSFQCLYVQKHVDPRAPSATQAIVARQHEMERPTCRYPPLLVFAEGTTTNGSFITQFRTGAFRAGTPVQPVVLRFAGRRFIPTWDTIPALYYIFRLLTQFSNTVSVQFLRGHVPTDAEKQDAALFAQNVRRELSEASGIPMCSAQRTSKWRLHDVIRSGGGPWKWYQRHGVPDPRIVRPSAVLTKHVGDRTTCGSVVVPVTGGDNDCSDTKGGEASSGSGVTSAQHSAQDGSQPPGAESPRCHSREIDCVHSAKVDEPVATAEAPPSNASSAVETPPIAEANSPLST